MEETVTALQAAWPIGTRVRLNALDGVQAPAPGTCGTITGVDDNGQVHVVWDTGSTLALLDGIDTWERI